MLRGRLLDKGRLTESVESVTLFTVVDYVNTATLSEYKRNLER